MLGGAGVFCPLGTAALSGRQLEAGETVIASSSFITSDRKPTDVVPPTAVVLEKGRILAKYFPRLAAIPVRSRKTFRDREIGAEAAAEPGLGTKAGTNLPTHLITCSYS
jgi:hypothetical protein